MARGDGAARCINEVWEARSWQGMPSGKLFRCSLKGLGRIQLVCRLLGEGLSVGGASWIGLVPC